MTTGLVIKSLVGQLAMGDKWPENTDSFQSLRATFTYRITAPFEVSMAVRYEDETIEWVVARDTILDGVSGNVVSGMADFQVWHDDEKFYIRLSSNDGACILRFNFTDIKMLTRRMKLICPRGSEEMDMDLVIAKILRQEAM